MKFGLGLGLCGSSAGYNFCVTLGSDGANLRGFAPSLTTPSGSITPDTTSDGTEIYSFYWDITDGKFIMQFGASGTTQLDNNSVIIDDGGTGLALEWDSTEEYYTATDKTVSDTLSSTTGEEECFLMIAIATLEVWYDYSELETE